MNGSESMDIPGILKHLRGKYNYKQKDVADYLNISKSAYGYYEQGRNEMDIRTIVMLSELYNVSTDYLLGKTSVEEKTLSEDEQQILAMYKLLPENEKSFFKGYLFAKSQKEI